jgi:hypothetical protein
VGLTRLGFAAQTDLVYEVGMQLVADALSLLFNIVTA